MTIKRMLFTLTIILVVMLVFVSGKSLITAKSLYDNAAYATKMTPVIDELLAAASHWAVERGATNSALAYPKKAPGSMIKIIKERRALGDEAYKNALKTLSTIDFEGKDALLKDTEEKYNLVVEIREKIDDDLDKAQITRDTSVMKNWVPAISSLILSSQALRFDAGQIFSQNDPGLAAQTQIKHLSWIMSEYAGRERAILGATISSGTAINNKKLATLSEYHGNVETAWDTVLKIMHLNHDKELEEAVKNAKEHYFGTFQNIRQSIYDAGMEGEAYPISSSDWITTSTAAIDTILSIQDASIEQTHNYTDDIQDHALKVATTNGAISLFGALIGLLSLFIIAQKVVKPLDGIKNTMIKLADGDTSISIPYLQQKNEIGDIAETVQVFKENALQKEQLEMQQVEAEKQAKADKKKAMADLANKFDTQVGSLIDSLASASTELQSTAESMRHIADENSQSSQTVAASSEEASANVNTVASAMEEMSASSKEIAMQITAAKGKSNDTATSANEANRTVTNLEELVSNIGEVVIAIQDIAEQTNLLALNATIEAARAGEAGKGFAVVADEVKKLATETGQKTGEINTRIIEIQDATKASVEAMEKIINNISEIDGSVAGVSAAVEEQNATNSEIVRSINEASQGVQQVSQIIQQVQNSASETGQSADDVLDAARNVSELSENLKVSVDAFLDEIRTGQ